MTRPLLICDCDEVLLHMVRHFGVWLRERHDIAFAHETGSFAADDLRRWHARSSTSASGACSTSSFPPRWSARRLVPGAAEALAAIAETADIVILTNLGDHCRDHRIDAARARTASTTASRPIAAARAIRSRGWSPNMAIRSRCSSTTSPCITNRSPSTRPQVHRLHLVAEPAWRRNVPPAPFAHARIDDWDAGARLDRRSASPRTNPPYRPKE